MADCMMFPDDWRDFLKDYSFVDSEEVYTNGSCLIPVFRVEQLIEHLLKAQEPITGETSDGYHTFNELYHHRAVLFSVIVANYPDRAWKSKKHHDGTMYDGMFIVGIETPSGQATYHYDINPYWDMFKCQELEYAPEWDGHTPAQAIERIGELAGLKAQEPHVLTLEEACGRDYCFYEYRATGYVEPASVVLSGMLLNGTLPLVEVYRLGREGAALVAANGYGHEWRCWTSKPDEKVRVETPWTQTNGL